MVALVGCRPKLCSLPLSPCLCWWAAITQSARHTPPLPALSSIHTSLFVFPPTRSSLWGGRVGRNFGISNVLLHTNTHQHTCTLQGDYGALGLSASERGVSGNPLELVCEGLVNQRGKKGTRKEEWREKKWERKKELTGFWAKQASFYKGFNTTTSAW